MGVGYDSGYGRSSYGGRDSPLNCYFTPFCSTSLIDDTPFKSICSFFDFHLDHGSFEVNPPFVDGLRTL